MVWECAIVWLVVPLSVCFIALLLRIVCCNGVKSAHTIRKLQVYDTLLYFSHKQPNDGCFVAETCGCHL